MSTPTILSLDHLTVFDVQPSELVSIAAELGCPHVSLWTQAPLAGAFPVVTAENLAETRRRMNNMGVTLYNVECFNLAPDVIVEDFLPALERGAELGGRSALVINYSDPDEGRCAENFARLADLARPFGMRLNIEFISMGQVRTPADAVRLIRRSGVPDAGINADLLHLVRTETDPAVLGELPAGTLGYAQICDGPLVIDAEAQATEGMQQRQVPGAGEFPVDAFIRSLPTEIVIGVEVPQRTLRDAGVSPLERARKAVAGTRAALARAGR